MIICPNTYYKERLLGKDSAEIALEIDTLRREIKRLRRVVENPAYEDVGRVTERDLLRVTMQYLERAKDALTEAGGVYFPTAEELLAERFCERVKDISKITLKLGSYRGNSRCVSYTLTENDAVAEVSLGRHGWHTGNRAAPVPRKMSAKELQESLVKINVGAWRREYRAEQYGVYVYDGGYWSLYISYRDGGRLRHFGENAYPYNFGELRRLFGI